MTLGNMRHLGVQRLVASCLNDACRHEGLIDVSCPLRRPVRELTHLQPHSFVIIFLHKTHFDPMWAFAVRTRVG